jgi:hypothetical protein
MKRKLMLRELPADVRPKVARPGELPIPSEDAGKKAFKAYNDEVRGLPVSAQPPSFSSSRPKLSTRRTYPNAHSKVTHKNARMFALSLPQQAAVAPSNPIASSLTCAAAATGHGAGWSRSSS